MSYILNALRKSERERQAIEPNTVTDRIIVHQPPQYRNSTKLTAALIGALVAINLAVLAYFLGFTQKSTPVETLSFAAVLDAEPLPRAEKPSPSLTMVKPAAPNKPVIANTAETKTPVPVTPAPAKPEPAVKMPLEAVKPALLSPRPVAALPAVKPIKVAKQVIEPIKPQFLQPAVRSAEPLKDNVEKAAPAPVQNDWPFLDELPADFRRSLPALPINVFSYSSTVAERFVMIDMVKYVPGQQIKDELELKEIRPDSIVVHYNDRTFKIRRP